MIRRMIAIVLPLIALSQMAIADDLIVQSLIVDLHASAGESRYLAARRLGRIGAPAAPAIPELVRLLGDQAAPHQFDIQYLGPRVHDAAAEALARIGPQSLDALVTVLSTGNATARQSAASALRQLGPGARSAFPALKAAMTHPDEYVGWHAIMAVSKLGEDPEVVVPLLLEITRNVDEDHQLQRKAALSVLADADPSGVRVLPRLTEAIQDEDGNVAYAALQALQKLGPLAQSAIPELTRLLSTEKTRSAQYADIGGSALLRGDVARTLGLIGPAASPALPQLVVTMDVNVVDEIDSFFDGGAKLNAAAAIVRIDPKHSAAPRARQMVMEAKSIERIRFMGDDAAAIELLTATLRVPDSDDLFTMSHASAIRSLGEMGTAAAPAIPLLIEMLESPDHSDDHLDIVDALGTLGTVATAALPALESVAVLWRSKTPWRIDTVEEAIWRVRSPRGD